MYSCLTKNINVNITNRRRYSECNLNTNLVGYVELFFTFIKNYVIKNIDVTCRIAYEEYRR